MSYSCNQNQSTSKHSVDAYLPHLSIDSLVMISMLFAMEAQILFIIYSNNKLYDRSQGRLVDQVNLVPSQSNLELVMIVYDDL